MPETQLREVTLNLRSVDHNTREFSGLAVPWETEISIWGMRERFARNSIVDSDDALVFWRHQEPIGKLRSNANTDAGWDITGLLSTTPRAEEAYTLLRDGTLDRLSVYFVPLEWHTETNAEGQEVTVYTRAQVREVSIVPFPAYDTAKVSQVRSEQPTPEGVPPMTDTLTRAEVDTLLADRLGPVETQLRGVETGLARLGDAAPAAASGPRWRSAGEFLKAIARGDEEATEFHRAFTDDSPEGDDFRRAYTGGTLADAAQPNTWLSDEIRLIEQRRKVTNTFTREALPAEGNVLEYLQLKSNSISVAKQANEGDDLPFGKIVLESKTTPVETYGGYTQLSRQQIERSSAPILNTSKRALDIEYARASEAKVRATLAAVIATRLGLAANVGHLASVSLATVKAVDWLDRITDAAELYEDRGHNLEGLYVAKDVFKTMYRLTDGANQNLMKVYGEGVNQTGYINVKGLEGNLANLPIKLLPGAAAGTASFYDSIAITTWDQAGAPMQLQDENIINLSKTFSVYGYLAAASQFPDAILPIKFAA